MKLLKRIFLFAVVALTFTTSFTSCKTLQSKDPIVIVPAANPAILQDEIDLGKQLDLLYLNMEQSEDKSYDTYSFDYANLEALINSIVVRIKARPKSEAILKQAEFFRKIFLRNKAEHKIKGSINDAEIRQYKRYSQDALNPLIVSEMSLK